MVALFQGWGFTLVALGLVGMTFGLALVMLGRQLRRVRAIADYLGYELASELYDSTASSPPRITTEVVRNEVAGVTTAQDPAWAYKQIRGWQMDAQRLEPALAFWVDLLRQLGLLFTVLGLGLSLTMDVTDVATLLEPLGLAVWTTVAGLFLSLVLTAVFSRRVVVWADTCEKNVEAWDARRRAAQRSRRATSAVATKIG